MDIYSQRYYIYINKPHFWTQTYDFIKKEYKEINQFHKKINLFQYFKYSVPYHATTGCSLNIVFSLNIVIFPNSESTAALVLDPH